VGIPEFTPAEMPLAGYLILEGISHFVEAGTSDLQGGEDVRRLKVNTAAVEIMSGL